MSHMETIGVRELRRDASRWLAHARAGEIITITDRGRPVAQLGPLPEPTGYDALVAAGKVTPGDGRSLDELRADMDRDFPIDDDGPPLSDILEEMRRDERY